MKNAQDSKPPEVTAKFSEKFLAQKHRKDTKSYFLATWLTLFLAVVFGLDMWQGFRSGQWVDIGVKMTSLPVPWWVAGALCAGALLLSYWCFTEYLKLKRLAFKYASPNEDADAEHQLCPDNRKQR